MRKYLYAWDFGAGLGHLVMAKPILEKLAQGYNKVFLVVPNIDIARNYLGSLELELIERPSLGSGIFPKHQISRCWTELQLELGYGQSTQLAKNLQAWKQLLLEIKPKCVLSDYSFSLQILRAVWKFPLIRLGNGFCCPPVSALDTTFFPDFPVTPAERAAISAELMQAVTAAQLAVCGGATQNPQHLFRAEATVLWTVPELDHFPKRDSAERFAYFGPITSSQTKIPNWCQSGTPKMLVYLWNFPGIELILDYLKIVRYDTLVIQRDFPAELTKQYSCHHLRFIPPDLNMQQALAECDLFIGNCGPGTAFEALSVGKPCLLCPGHLEQAILGLRLEEQGLARIFWRQRPADCIAEIQNYFDDPQAFTKVSEFPKKYQPYSISDQWDRLSKVITQVQHD